IEEQLLLLTCIYETIDWEREYEYDKIWKSIVGIITTQEQGIPKEEEDFYKTRGYSRNDRVGKSGLEEQYEDVLRGRKEQTEYTTTKKGDVLGTDVVVEGERGKDLMLTIDMEFQEK